MLQLRSFILKIFFVILILTTGCTKMIQWRKAIYALHTIQTNRDDRYIMLSQYKQDG